MSRSCPCSTLIAGNNSRALMGPFCHLMWEGRVRRPSQGHIKADIDRSLGDFGKYGADGITEAQVQLVFDERRGHTNHENASLDSERRGILKPSRKDRRIELHA